MKKYEIGVIGGTGVIGSSAIRALQKLTEYKVLASYGKLKIGLEWHVYRRIHSM